MLDAALAYARHGIPVLPVHTPAPGGGCSCGRATCERPGKHPRLRHGLMEASTDPLTIEAWWARWPEANIGLRTGIVMDVADVDSAEGWHGLRHLLGGELPPGPQVRTGGGGWHFWFRPSGHGNRVRVVPGLDWRGTGGYVLAPPSRHARGSTYYWVVRPGASNPPVPPELAEMIAGPEPPGVRLVVPTPTRHPLQYAAAALAAESDRVARAPAGTRNDTLNRAAFALGRLVAAGWTDAATVTRELTAAAAWAGLGRAETVRTIRSGLTAGLRVGAPHPNRPHRTTTAPHITRAHPATDGPHPTRPTPAADTPHTTRPDPTTDAPRASRPCPATDVPRATRPDAAIDVPRTSRPDPATDAPRASHPCPATDVPRASQADPATGASHAIRPAVLPSADRGPHDSAAPTRVGSLGGTAGTDALASAEVHPEPEPPPVNEAVVDVGHAVTGFARPQSPDVRGVARPAVGSRTGQSVGRGAGHVAGRALDRAGSAVDRAGRTAIRREISGERGRDRVA